MKKIILFFLFFGYAAHSQTDTIVANISGTVVNSETRLPMNNVHVINTTQIKGTVTITNGIFEIAAKANDTLLFSYLGFESIKVKVTNDWVKNNNVTVALTEKAYALEEVIISQYNLTGYIQVDTHLIPVKEDNFRYNISGISAGYEVGNKSPEAVSKALGAIFNPADLLYNVFGKRPKEMKKLKEMKKDDTVRNLLATKFDRVTLAALLEIDKEEIPQILESCNYSEYFIKTANDLQILDAINSCYEEYKILKKNK